MPSLFCVSFVHTKLLFTCSVQRGPKGLVKDCFKEAISVGLNGGELSFQLVTQRHKFVYLGDEAVLFIKGRKRNQNRIQNLQINVLLCGCRCELQQVCLPCTDEVLKISS